MDWIRSSVGGETRQTRHLAYLGGGAALAAVHVEEPELCAFWWVWVWRSWDGAGGWEWKAMHSRTSVPSANTLYIYTSLVRDETCASDGRGGRVLN